MKLSPEEKAALDALSTTDDCFDQDAPYRDSAGRTLTEIQQANVNYTLNPARKGLMCYDSSYAEKLAKIKDPRYTFYDKETQYIWDGTRKKEVD